MTVVTWLIYLYIYMYIWKNRHLCVILWFSVFVEKLILWHSYFLLICFSLHLEVTCSCHELHHGKKEIDVSQGKLCYIIWYICKYRQNFTNKPISIYCELLNVEAQGWQGGVATSMMINVGKVLLMSSDCIKGFWGSYTHTIPIKTTRSGMVHLGPNMFFHPFFYVIPIPRPTETKKNDK